MESTTGKTAQVSRREPDDALHLFNAIQGLAELQKTRAELYTSQLRSELALESAGIGIWEWNAQSDAGFYSERTCEILDVEPMELSSEVSWLARIHPDDLSGYLETRSRHLQGDIPFHRSEVRICLRDGSYRWVEDLGKIVERDADGQPLRVVGTLLDIHQRKLMEETLSWQAREIATLLEHSPDGILRYNRDLHLLYSNPATQRFTGGTDPGGILGRPIDAAAPSAGLRDTLYLRALKKVFETCQESELESEFISAGGAPGWLHARFTPEFDSNGEVVSVLVLIRDVTETVRQRQKIEELAFSDPLTRLPNRARFNDKFRVVLAEAAARSRGFALIVIDLDNFKDVNDTLGHVAGDELLCTVTARLLSVLGANDMLARLGGDEFAVLLENTDSQDQIAGISSSLLDCMREACRLGGRDMFISSSFGIACFPADGTTVDELFARADAALYEAKARGRNNFQFYDASFTEKMELRLKLGSALRTACSRNELQLHYQPKVELKTGNVIGAEALLRWRHPEFGLVAPSVFIPIAEENGTIVEIGHWVIRQATQAAAALNQDRALPLKIAINLSARQFFKNNIAVDIGTALAETGCEAGWLECEITESLLLEDCPNVQATLRDLQAMGISIAIDDFGTGHSALTRLGRFPIDVLKIDRSFVEHVGDQPKDAELVRAFVSIATALSMQTVAEGVENDAQAKILLQLGCSFAQGYHYGRPAPVDEFIRSLSVSASLASTPVQPTREGSILRQLEHELDKAWSECGSGQMATALSRLQAVALRLEHRNDPALDNRCEWQTAWTLFRLGETEKAFAHAQRAKDLASGLDLATQAKSAALSARLLSCLGLIDESYVLASSGVDLAEKSGDEWAKALALYILSISIWLGKDADAALPLSQRAISIARVLGDKHLISWLLINHGCILAERADSLQGESNDAAFTRGYEEAIVASIEACDLGQANSDNWAERTALANAAEFYAYLGQFVEAHRLLGRWKDVQGECASRRTIHYLSTCSDVLFREGRLEEARDYCQRAIEMAEMETDKDQVHICTKVLSKIHEAIGDDEAALRLYKRYHQLEQKFEGERVKRRARVAAIVYETEKLRELAQEADARASASEKEAATDPLTGVANRRRFEQAFEALLAEGRQNFAIVFTDLDHFKSINDRFSHAVGDEVIKTFTQILIRCCRQDDIVARIGGEEFVLLLNRIDARGAAAVCERLLATMREYEWSRIATGLAVTTSAGLARGEEAVTGSELLALADTRLYEAKASGRNRVVAADDVVARAS